MVKNVGKIFEESFEGSAKRDGLWTFRVRDVNYASVKKGHRIARNLYDTIIFNDSHLFALELKSTQEKSVSISGTNPHIKPHQIEALTEAYEFNDVVAGVVLNFRTYDNQTFFIPIDRLNEYIHFTQNQSEHPYRCREGKKLNKSSISLDICQEIGVEVMSVKKRVHYHYFVKQLTQELIARERQLKDKK